MAAPIVIKSTDPGVPVINGMVGTAIPLFDYILVTKLGWTKEFSGTNKAVYKPATAQGNRMLYRIEDTVGKKYRISMYETMSDVNTGSGVSGPFWGYKSYTADATARPWTVIGDGAGVYIRQIWYNDDPNDAELNYFGEGVNIFSTDAWLSLITGQSASGDTYPSSFGFLDSPTIAGSSNDCCRVARKLSGAADSINTSAALYPGGGVDIGGDIMGGTDRLPAALKYPVDGKLLYTRPIINNGEARSVRGYFPGLYCPEHGSGLTDKQLYVDGEKSLMALRISPGNNTATMLGWVLIDTGEGFRS